MNIKRLLLALMLFGAISVQAQAPGTTFRDCADCPEMVVVPAGSFTMGSPEFETGRDKDESPQRTVSLARPFAAGRFEVTRGQFAAFVADSGYQSQGSESLRGQARIIW